MAGVVFQGFVLDEDSGHLLRSMRSVARQIVSLSQIGITKGCGSPDEAIIQHARNAGRIVVTGNTWDYTSAIRDAALKCRPGVCYEGGGLISVPNGTWSYPFKQIERTMTLDDAPIGWEDVYLCNLHIRVNRNHSFDVLRLPLCEYFIRDHALNCTRCIALSVETQSISVDRV